MALFIFILKNYDEAVFAFEKMIALNDTDYINWGNLADAYRFANNEKYIDSFNKAIFLAEQALELNSKDKYAVASIAYYYANVSNIEKTHYYAKKITEKDLGDNQFFIAAAYARLKMNKAAIKYLEYAIYNKYSLSEVSNSPLLDNIRNDPHYQKLITNSQK